MRPNKFVSAGMLPKELPPSFSSKSAGAALAAAGAPVPKINKDLHALPARFSLARAGGVRRDLGIPNPVLHYHLSALLAANWTDVKSKINRSQLTCSAPVLKGTRGRAVATKVKYSELAEERAKARRHGRYILLADVAECYRSVYTHSLAWVLHTKELTRGNPNDFALWGNGLDRAIRNGQGRQTNGIPVGPDTSLVAAELVLTEIDVLLTDRARPAGGFRFFDDYELTYRTLPEAERALAVLQTVASAFGMHLNQTKTRVVELPQTMEASWVHDVRAFDLSNSAVRSRARILHLFDVVFAHKQATPAANVVAFAAKRISRQTWTPDEWAFVMPMMLQLAVVEPAAMQHVAEALVAQYRGGRDVPRKTVSQFVAATIVRHAPLGNTFEVAWALWCALRLDARIPRPACEALEGADDCVVPLLALDARDRGLLAAKLDVSKWVPAMTAAELFRERWLLSYEAAAHGWLPSSGVSDRLKEEGQAFAYLRQNDVQFYRRTARASPPEPEELDAPEDDDDDDEHFYWTGDDDDAYG